jgi:transcription-repair coupling factor (superfamily II helicase)
MLLYGLLALLRQSQTYLTLLRGLKSGGAAPDQRLLRAARPFTIAALANDIDRPILVVTSQVERAYNIAEQLPVWLPDTPVLRFAEPSALFYDRSPWASNTIRSRLDVLGALAPPMGLDPGNLNGASGQTGTARRRPSVVVTSALALMQRTLPAREFRAGSRVLKPGQRTDEEKLLRMWLSIGYTPTSVVTEPGMFSRRGGIIDIFPINAARPARIEFFGDEIESLREFDAATQRSTGALLQLPIIPAREALPKLAAAVADKLQAWFETQPDDDVASARPDETELRSEAAFPTLEFYLPLFYGTPAGLLDYRETPRQPDSRQLPAAVLHGRRTTRGIDRPPSTAPQRGGAGRTGRSRIGRTGGRRRHR